MSWVKTRVIGSDRCTYLSLFLGDKGLIDNTPAIFALVQCEASTAEQAVFSSALI